MGSDPGTVICRATASHWQHRSRRMSIESCQAVCHNHDHGHQCGLPELKHDKRKQSQLSKLDNLAIMEKTESQGAMTSE